jgi:HSP20 family protein
MPREPWKPIRPLSNLREQLEETFAELLHEPWKSTEGREDWQPAIDIYETADAYLVEADLPGVRPEDVQIRLQGRWLTICGSRQGSAARRHDRGVHVERTCGTFCRTFFLAHWVDTNAIETRLESGIYRIRLPKERAS